MQWNRVIVGDCLRILRTLPDESVDLLCTDPPYGLAFMGKDWDKALPPKEVWTECLRVLKPGAFAFVMSAPRSDVQARMAVALEDAGFEISFTPIYWTYASGFPKALNIGKAIDKRLRARRAVIGRYVPPNGKVWNLRQADERRIRHAPGAFTASGIRTLHMTAPATAEARALDGSYGGFQPKPAVEVIIVAMKPLEEKTFVEQALKNRKGVSWLDDARIPVSGERVPRLNKPYRRKRGRNFGGARDQRLGTVTGFASSGRFPANLLVSDDALADGKNRRSQAYPYRAKKAHPGAWGEDEVGGDGGYCDSGSFARYFDLDRWWEEKTKAFPDSVRRVFPFLVVPKASKGEKDAGLDSFPTRRPDTRTPRGMGSFEEKGVLPGKNHHPTVKPIRLMSYLITLGSRPGDVILDPFAGSGTTGIAAKLLGRRYLLIEKDHSYAGLAAGRVAATPSPGPAAYRVPSSTRPTWRPDPPRYSGRSRR